MAPSLLAELGSIVGAADVVTDAGVRAGYETDWTRRYHGTCDAVVRPGSTGEVAAVLALCAAEGVTVVPQAGNTGLVGGSVPRGAGHGPCIVLSLRRLDSIGPVDPGTRQLTAGAGVTIAHWRSRARRAGLDVPIDFAARDTATVGGAIATDAGGSRVVRFGTMRRQVVGVEAVLAGGAVVGSLAGLPKETAGLHWPSLLTGSEGTLAVVTAARLRLVPWFRETATAMIVVGSLDDAIDVLARVRTIESLDSVEFVQPAAMELVADHLDRRPPVTAPAGGTYLVVECAGHENPSAELGGRLAASSAVLDAVVTTEGPARARLVEFRDRLTEAINTEAGRAGGAPFKLDVAVPPALLGELMSIARRAADDDGARLIPFGHLAEGNVHLNHLGATDTDGIARRVLTAVADLGGTISAEHGIGIAKAGWLPLIRSTAELAAQRAIKQALDPTGILNPGVLTPPEVTPPLR